MINKTQGVETTQQNSSDMEISLLDILQFFKRSYKTIFLVGVLGFAISVGYLVVAPKRYEAVAQIAMAQIGVANGNMNLLGVNIEEPSLLISRLSLPTSFTPQVLISCGIDSGANSSLALVKSIELVAPKGVANIVELKIFGKSPEIVAACINATFELIKATQAQIVAPYIADAKARLDDDIDRLQKAKDLVAKADKSGSVMGAAYLSTRDEIRFLLDEIAVLKNVVTSNQSRATRLIAPIYVSDTPVTPKKQAVLLGGLLSGLFLGLLIALGHHIWVRLEIDIQSYDKKK